MSKQIITRFAPSPTGFLHIGGARTALFNYLFAKHHGGKFLLRIEDTDRARSTDEAIKAILEGLDWLGLKADEEPIYQFARSPLHAKAAHDLVAKGGAYYCFMSKEEIDAKRDAAMKENKSFIVNSPWRDAEPDSYPKDVKPVIRLKAPRSGETIINDLVQGDVSVAYGHLDDMILLRSDGTPTYMLAVVVDDHDMGITHIIRGDDHLTNAARQILLYKAFGWDIPQMAHIPLIHGPDGAKLSKRHGALGIDAYEKMGYLPEAICNYLVRLGWSHGDDEIISREDSIKWFDIEHIGKSPSRIDFNKMNFVNAHYLREMPNDLLLPEVINLLSKEMIISEESKNSISKALDALKPRTSLLNEISELAKIYVIERDPEISDESKEIIKNTDPQMIQDVINLIKDTENLENISEEFKNYAGAKNIKLGDVMKPIRCLITGMTNSPSVFEIINILGKETSIKRLSREI